MSTIISRQISTKHHKNYPINMEMFKSALEVADTCKTRQITNSWFDNMQKNSSISRWNGVKSYSEAIDLLRGGYQPIVDELKLSTKINRHGEQKRIQFRNEVQGFMPVVPLAMMGVPNSMINTTIKPIKRKVLDVYYDTTANAGVKPDAIIKVGQTLLGAILELEQQGYKFNLYAVQTYSDRDGADCICVKVKSSDKPLDLKRMSFPLCHTAFFRVIGFDWYSKFPKGTYRSGYGHNINQEFESEYPDLIKQLFGENAIMFNANELLRDGNADSIKSALLQNK